MRDGDQLNSGAEAIGERTGVWVSGCSTTLGPAALDRFHDVRAHPVARLAIAASMIISGAVRMMARRAWVRGMCKGSPARLRCLLSTGNNGRGFSFCRIAACPANRSAESPFPMGPHARLYS